MDYVITIVTARVKRPVPVTSASQGERPCHSVSYSANKEDLSLVAPVEGQADVDSANMDEEYRQTHDYPYIQPASMLEYICCSNTLHGH
jgi:hypothetical protein